mgnify:CR=1 FL=1
MLPFLFVSYNYNHLIKTSNNTPKINKSLNLFNNKNNRIPVKEYNKLVKDIKFELGAIAQHCLDVYNELGPNYYDDYVPIRMMYQTDVFFNFVDEYKDAFERQNWVSLKEAYSLYKAYCDETNVQFKMPMYKFKEQLKDYFDEFFDVTRIDGVQTRSVYMGFKSQKFSKDTP